MNYGDFLPRSMPKKQSSCANGQPYPFFRFAFRCCPMISIMLSNRHLLIIPGHIRCGRCGVVLSIFMWKILGRMEPRRIIRDTAIGIFFDLIQIAETLTELTFRKIRMAIFVLTLSSVNICGPAQLRIANGCFSIPMLKIWKLLMFGQLLPIVGGNVHFWVVRNCWKISMNAPRSGWRSKCRNYIASTGCCGT